MELLSGGEMIMRALKEEQVKMIFGYPGGAVLHIYDALYQQDAVEHILVRHEQAAVHAADGFSRSTGEVGVALVTSGPGATNAITGIATAYMDSIPLVVISGNVPSHLMGSDAFQETDMIGCCRPIVKHSFFGALDRGDSERDEKSVPYRKDWPARSSRCRCSQRHDGADREASI